MIDKSLASRRDIRDVATQKVGEWTVPAWARPVRTTGADGEDMAYGAVTSPAGDALLFGGVREVIDEDKQKLLEGKHNLQEVVKSRASAALGKLNFDACLPKRKDDNKEFRADDDEIEYVDNHVDRKSFIH